jgi:recombinational DNA repair protein (RecF pathway)
MALAVGRACETLSEVQRTYLPHRVAQRRRSSDATANPALLTSTLSLLRAMAANGAALSLTPCAASGSSGGRYMCGFR